MYQKVKENPSLLRDSASKGIINTDIEGYNKMMKERKQEEEHHNMMDKIQRLEEDITDVKNMLAAIFKKVS